MPDRLVHPYLFLDTETGGLDLDRHSLLSLGLVVGDEGNGTGKPARSSSGTSPTWCRRGAWP